MDATTTDEAPARNTRSSSLFVADIAPIDTTASQGTRFTHGGEEDVAAFPASTAASACRLSIAPDKKPATQEPISAAESPLVEKEAPVLLHRQAARAPAESPTPGVPVDYRIEAGGGRASGWSLSRVCLGVCAVALFVLSALIAGTLAVHTVRRVELVSRLLQEIINETRVHSPEGTTPTSATTTSPALGRGDVIDEVVTAGNPAGDDGAQQNGTCSFLRGRRE
ncbi:uncharacterized protein LOC144120242 [Amblyomma americanum]